MEDYDNSDGEFFEQEEDLYDESSDEEYADQALAMVSGDPSGFDVPVAADDDDDEEEESDGNEEQPDEDDVSIPKSSW